MSITITGDTVKSAISTAISNSSISTGCKIYKEQAKQAFKKPCFFIWPIKVGSDKQLSNRAKQSHQMVVRYFPKDCENPKYSELTDVGTQLMEVLDYIDLGGGDIIRGNALEYEIIDNVLHFFVTYSFHIKKEVAQQPQMATVTALQRIKEADAINPGDLQIEDDGTVYYKPYGDGNGEVVWRPFARKLD